MLNQLQSILVSHKNQNDEWWLDINPLYQISNIGRVRNKSGHIIKTRLHRGYYRVTLSINGFKYTEFIHRLVAKAFIMDPHLLVVTHIDGNKFNNNVNNLEVISRGEFLLRNSRKRKGVSKTTFGTYVARIVLHGFQYELGTYATQEEAYQVYYDKYKEVYGTPPWPNHIPYINTVKRLSLRKSPEQIKNSSEYLFSKYRSINKLRGVYKGRGNNTWVSYIQLNGKQTYLGSFKNKEEAYQVYYDKYKEVHGVPPWQI